MGVKIPSADFCVRKKLVVFLVLKEIFTNIYFYEKILFSYTFDLFFLPFQKVKKYY